MQNYFEQLRLPVQRAQNARTQVLIQHLPQYLDDNGRAAQGSMEAVQRFLLKEHGTPISRISLYKWAAIHRAARLAFLGEKLPELVPSGISPKLWKQMRLKARRTILPSLPPPLPPSPPVLEVPTTQEQHALVQMLVESQRALAGALHELRELVATTRTNGNGNGNGHHEEGAVAVLEAPAAAPPAPLLKAGPLPSDFFAKPTEKKNIIEVMQLPTRTMGGWRMVYTPSCCKDLEALPVAFRVLVREHLIYFVSNPRDPRLHRRASRDVHTHRLKKDHGVKGCDLETLRIGRFRVYLAPDDVHKIYNFTGLISNADRN